MKSLRWLAVAALVAAVGLGLVRVLALRAEPPAWAVGGHLYDGFVAIDGHAHRARAVRDWLAGDDPGGASMRALLRGDEHVTALLIPALTAVVSFATGSIPWSYFLVVVAMFAAAAHCAGSIARALAPPEQAARAYWVSLFVLAVHITTTRTVGLLILDWGIGLCTAGCALAAMRWTRGGGARSLAAMAVWTTLGLFTKISALPLCAVPPVIALAAAGPPALRLRRAAAAVLPGLLALALASAWSYGMVGVGPLERDAEHLLGTRARPLEFAAEMVLLAQGGPVLLWLARPLPPLGLGLLAACLLELVSVAVFRLPSTARLYVPTLVLGVPLVVGCGGAMLGRPRVLGAFAFANLGLAAFVLLRGGG